jgi:sensor c-di-GMP phosphodiesterase-like protein
MNEELILLTDFIRSTEAEIEFIDLLEEEGLIQLIEREQTKYIQIEQLADLETFTRLHYDLYINIEGIDVIRNLLLRMREMETELKLLRNR